MTNTQHHQGPPLSIPLNQDYSEKVRYDSPDYPIYIRRGLLSHYPNHTAPNHWHEDLELIAVTSGEMEYNVNGEILRLGAGEGILVNSGQMHFGFSHRKSECDFICVLLHPMLLCSAGSYERDYLLPVTRNAGMPYLFLDPDVSWQEKILQRTRSFYQEREQETAPLKILAGFAEILGLLYTHMPKKETPELPRNQDLSILKNMTVFIHKNYEKKLSLADIASAGAVGQSKCCKLFDKYYSQSPVLYLNQYRLAKSVELLRDSDLSMIEISLSVGFHSASYYTETFRKWMKKTPSQLRREFRAAAKGSCAETVTFQPAK